MCVSRLETVRGEKEEGTKRGQTAEASGDESRQRRTVRDARGAEPQQGNDAFRGRNSPFQRVRLKERDKEIRLFAKNI